MNAAVVLCSIFCSQLPDVVIGPPLYYDIKFCGRIESKYYVQAILPQGKIIEVPIVNGYVPRVDVDYRPYGEVRTFCYDELVVYKGGVVNYTRGDRRDCVCTSPPPQITPMSPLKLKPIPKLEAPHKSEISKPIPSETKSKGNVFKKPLLTTFEDEIQDTKSFPRYEGQKK